MAKASKPVELLSKHLTKKEIDDRKQEENKLKGMDDLVYNPPSYLTDKEKELYSFLVEQLYESKVLCNLDIAMLETTVDSILKMKECKQIINSHGIVIVKDNGDLAKNPACTAYKDYNAIFNKCCMELGLSPSARSRLAQININAKQEKEDPLLKVLRSDAK